MNRCECGAFASPKGGACRRCKKRIVERKVVRPWINDQSTMICHFDGSYPQTELLRPWDLFVQGDQPVFDIYKDWRMILNLHMGLELPDDLNQMIEIEGEVFPGYELLANNPEVASDVSGVRGGGVDPLHNALLIVCGSLDIGNGREVGNPRVSATANLCHYMATGWCSHDNWDKNLEYFLRANQRNFTLQDAVHCVFQFYFEDHTASAEWFLFDHKKMSWWG